MFAYHSIPPHIRGAFTSGMRRVVQFQLEQANGVSDAASATSAEGIAASRVKYRDERAYWNVGGPAMTDTDQMAISAAGTEVAVRVYRPTAGETLPAIVYLHGGGFTVGDLDTHDRVMRVLAAVSGAAVIGVDYTLAPEARFPQALHECVGVIAHFAECGQRYGIDGKRLALAGDSAGAMLALGAAKLLRGEPESAGVSQEVGARVFASIASMLLFYGDYGLTDSASRRLYGGFWDGMAPADLGTMGRVYLADPRDWKSPYLNLLASGLERALPPAFVIGAELDPLRDDSAALGQLLEIAGHDVQWAIVPGMLHSFLHFGRMVDEANEVLASAGMFAQRRFSLDSRAGPPDGTDTAIV